MFVLKWATKNNREVIQKLFKACCLKTLDAQTPEVLRNESNGSQPVRSSYLDFF